MKGGLKDACQRRPTDNQTTRSANYLTYLDTMNENLNKNIEQNVFPHWRNHNSLKGKQNLKFETH
jgi:hypothetical protein